VIQVVIACRSSLFFSFETGFTVYLGPSTLCDWGCNPCIRPKQVCFLLLCSLPYYSGIFTHYKLNNNSDTDGHGSGWWMVTDVTLFTTSVVFLYTNERASLSNGSLANSRIINSTRSPNAGMYTLLKVQVDVPYDKIQLLHQALEEYVRNRPREWLGLSSFRATRIEAAEGESRDAIVS
jgi:hypothetical protein